MEQSLYWLAGAIGVPVIQWIKKTMKIEGQAALWLTIGVSLILAVASIFINNEISPGNLSPENILGVFGQVLAAATLAYKFLVSK